MPVKARRNDPCPCGSGQRFKACCGRLAAASVDTGRSAAQRLPGDAVAQLNLGNALARRGRFEEAQAAFGRALAVHPEFAEAHHNLGDLLLQCGRFEEAQESSRRALNIRPDYAEAHHTLGNALLRLARVDEAIASFRRALVISPEFVEAQVSVAHALRSIGLLDEAVAGYRRALSIKPDFVAAHVALGIALRLLRRGEESELSCRNALALRPDCVAALAVLADLRADAGRFADAEELFRRAISIDPEYSEAWSGIARVRRMTPADGAWLTAAQRLVGQGLAPPRELSLRFAIGKYFDDVKDYDNAFVNYRRANELAKRCGPHYDRERLARTIDLIIRSHDRGWIERLRSGASQASRPVFIVGMLRSGTTLAEQILASHPAVHGAGELMFWGNFSATAMAAAMAVNSATIGLGEAALCRAGCDYIELIERLSAGAARVVDKFPGNFLLLGLIHAALPRARIIHMRRNPVDTCLSIYFQHFEAANAHVNDLEDLAHYYREYRRLMRHWRAVLPAGVLLEVPYEGLVLDLPAWSRRMIDFIDLPWDPRCLDFHRTAGTVVTASRWQVRQKISTSSVERWRNYEKFVGPLKALNEPVHPAPAAK